MIRLKAPYEQRSTAFENFFHSGSLDFPEDVLAHVRAVAAAVPTVVDVFADRPAILAPIVDAAAAVTVNWGASAPALLDVLTGVARPQGRLPFDLPRSMPAVEASRPDVPLRYGRPAVPLRTRPGRLRLTDAARPRIGREKRVGARQTPGPYSCVFSRGQRRSRRRRNPGCRSSARRRTCDRSQGRRRRSRSVGRSSGSSSGPSS
ncbi:glycoside hydrolase family 3 C-terminal domain-containing protein [Tessaracoccus sp.]|uniref:glycoside hydrolase family 3 C-terminal domain-containing protein n=1 Tax=Tessaracoccus sp. TaxID=1971211 RepID=UPI00344B8340